MMLTASSLKGFTLSCLLVLAFSAFALMLGCNLAPPNQTETVDKGTAVDNSRVSQPSPVPAISGLPLPTATPLLHLLPPPPDAFAPTTLEELIYFSPVIIRASLIPGSDTYGSESVPSSPGVAPTYKATHRFRFRVIEYLKGTGASDIVVTERSSDSYITEAEALRTAEDALEEEGNKELDQGSAEAVLFLEEDNVSGVTGASGQQTAFTFKEWIWGDLQYRINTLNKAWLPSQESSGVGGQSGDSDRYYLTDSIARSVGAAGSSGLSPRISLANLRSKIAAAEADLLAGRKIEGYEDCIRLKFDVERYLRGTALVGHQQTFIARASIESGFAWWTEVNRTTYEDYEVIGKEYARIWLEGTDKDFFFAEIDDDDKDYSNGYDELVATARPLPAGMYQVEIHGQFPDYVPCNYVPDTYDPLIVTVTAPAGTAHEAFFDPVTIGSAVGADGTNGALKPTAFTANGTATALQSLKWESGTVMLTLNPNASLSGLALDFIALNGSVSLTLLASDAKVDSAAGTLRWSMATQPWREGDKLMLRIRSATAAPRATSTPTPTPTATPTPTPTPTPAPAAPPGPGVSDQ